MEFHVFKTGGAARHVTDRCWCGPRQETAMDAETGDLVLIVTHDGGEGTDHVVEEVRR